MSPRTIFLVTAAICGILAYAYFGSGTVRAEQSAPICDYTMDEVLASFAEQGAPFAMVPEAELPELLANLASVTGEHYENVTRAFIVNANGNLLLGLEIDGCLIPPILLAPPARQSGRVGNETFA